MTPIRIGFLQLGRFSNDYYWRELHSLFNKKAAVIDLRTHQVDFELWNSFLPYGFHELEPLLCEGIKTLEKQGVDYIIIPNITLHFTLDRLNLLPHLVQKIIHPIKEIVTLLQNDNITKITLLGTKYTMDSPLMNDYFLSNGITPLPQTSEFIEKIDALRTAVYLQGRTTELEQEFNAITQYIDNPVICCTELSLLNSQNHPYDMVKNQLAFFESK